MHVFLLSLKPPFIVHYYQHIFTHNTRRHRIRFVDEQSGCNNKNITSAATRATRATISASASASAARATAAAGDKRQKNERGKKLHGKHFFRYCFYCRLYRQLLSLFPQIPCGVVSLPSR